MSVRINNGAVVARPVIRVLMIDDDEAEYDIIKPMLRESKIFDYQIDWVSTYRQGYTKLLSNAYAVCLLDYNLGMENGLDLMRRVKREGCIVPIILLTGATDETIDYRSMEQGAENFLQKEGITGAILERALRYSILHRKTQQELLAAREERVEMMCAAAQDLRAPLYDILTLTHQAEINSSSSSPLPAGVSHLVQYLLDQVDDLMDMSDPDADHWPRRREDIIDVGQAVDRALFSLRNLLQKRRIKVSVNLSRQLPEIKADLRMVRQMVISAVHHCLKYSRDAKGVTINVFEDGVALVIEVDDNGAGIAREQINMVLGLETNINLHNDSRPSLMRARRDIERHGGRLEIKARREKWTRIQFIFPAERVVRIKTSILDAPEKWNTNHSPIS